MEKRPHTSESQKRVQDYINETLLPELQIIFGTQYPGVKPQLSCALIVEGGLKLYLRKVDPEQMIGRSGLGKIYGFCFQKLSFPKRFRIAIPKINKVRIGKVHVKKDAVEVSLEYIRDFTRDFINWFFGKVIKQDIPKNIQVIITSTKENPNKRPAKSISSKTPKKDIAAKSPLQNSLQKNLDKISLKKTDIQKPLTTKNSKTSLTLKNGTSFSRTYFENIEITKNALRGIDSDLYKSIPSLSLFIEFSKDGLYLTNQSEAIAIYLDDKRLIRNRKKLVATDHFDILFNKVRLSCSTTKY